jgi:outer membrane protein OmpA-like peptidoglycan-associated protein
VGFSPPTPFYSPRTTSGKPLPVAIDSGRVHVSSSSLVNLNAAGESSNKKRRRRKTTDTGDDGAKSPEPIPAAKEEAEDVSQDVEEKDVDVDAMKELLQIKEIAKFQFDKDIMKPVGE